MIPRPASRILSRPRINSPRDPDFIIIGAMKAGTTTLYECLRRHPDVFMSDPKEPNYFSISEVYGRGRNWYRSLFCGATKSQLCGEASPSYTRFPRFPEAAQRLGRDLPTVKLIYILRDPVERFYSNYVFDRSFGGPNTMSEVFAKRPYVLETSRYVNQINRYLEFFPASQLHCVLLEDLRTDADAALASVFEFIGLAPLPVGVPTAKTFERGQPQTARMGNRLLTAARSAPGAGLAANVLPQGARQALREVFRKSLPESRLGKWVVDRQIAQAEPLSEAARQRLHDELDDSTLELEAYLGRDLSHWRRGGVRGR